MNNLKYALLSTTAKPPFRKHLKDAGADLYSDESDTEVKPNSFHIFKTGVVFKIPEGCVIQIWPKSRNTHLVAAGIIDQTFLGEILVKLVNYTNETMLIKKGDAIAQAVILPVFTPELEEVTVEKLREKPTQRGTTGGIVSQLEIEDAKASIRLDDDYDVHTHYNLDEERKAREKQILRELGYG